MAISVAGGVRPGKVIELEHKLLTQLIVGKQKSSSMFDEIDKELEGDANKLDIEREAVLARLAKQIEARKVFEAVSGQLVHTVTTALDNQLATPESLLAGSGISAAQLTLFELISHETLNINRIRPLIADLPWLERDLTNLVNSPAFRLKRSHRSEVKVTDLKLVLNFIGIDNLRTLIPYYCLRNWLPSGHAHLLWTTRKLWRYAMITGVAAKALAKLHEADEAFIYTSALLSMLGTSVVLNNGAKVYETTWGTWLREASASRDKELHDAVLATEFPANDIYHLVLSHGNKLNWQLLELLDFAASPLTQVQAELDNNLSFAELSAAAKLVAKASCFAKVLMLEEMRQLEPKEKRLMFDYYELNEQEVIRLKGQNYRKLDLY
ncbi:HDOD domain-containing protein [Shewanella sp. Scap07]|uniref:HDOD domain-containing protein n=1 Tax=Shewanella sp. Scap07 TaxID=2589987 RepID=UPI0015C19757|nr:HDOD domain-containing protein [Shewanella sp. Scap07]QLE86876.1 HDOD domain-containing protein [Shewanella sp. Scap07]